jgi:hypothetical protein
MKDVMQEDGMILSSGSFGKTETDRDAWLLDNPHEQRNVK